MSLFYRQQMEGPGPYVKIAEKTTHSPKPTPPPGSADRGSCCRRCVCGSARAPAWRWSCRPAGCPTAARAEVFRFDRSRGGFRGVGFRAWRRWTYPSDNVGCYFGSLFLNAGLKGARANNVKPRSREAEQPATSREAEEPRSSTRHPVQVRFLAVFGWFSYGSFDTTQSVRRLAGDLKTDSPSLGRCLTRSG